MAYIAKFKEDSKEYKNLKAAAALMTAFGNKVYYVSECYFDFGQDWTWTTILYYTSDWGSVQALYPAQQEAICSANTMEELVEAVKKVLAE